MTTTYDILAGVLIAAHGVQGGLKIRLATPTALSLIGGPTIAAGRGPIDVWLSRSPQPGADDPGGRLATVTSVKELRLGGSVYLIKIAGVRDRSAAEALVGWSVYAPAERRAPLQVREYFTHDLIGLDVMADNGRRYGKIVAVLSQPANDVYETDAGALIPAVAQVVLAVDLERRTMAVVDIAGLLPAEAEEIAPGDERPATESDGLQEYSRAGEQ